MDNIKNSTNINWYPGHMAKTKREIKEKLDLIDIVYEVIDSRMPISSKIVDIDDLIKNKPRILIATKYDICDKKVTDKILDNYKKDGYVVVNVDLKENKNTNMILEETRKIAKEINDKRIQKGMKPRKVRVLVVGVPNAGKSTLINRLVGKKAVVIGDKPGVTKSLGWIRIGSDIELLDSPGILWPKIENQTHAYNLACLSSIKEEILNLDDIALYILKTMNELYPEKLEERYGIKNFDIENIEEILYNIGKKRGALVRGGIVDYDKVYNIIVRDLKDGLLGNVTFDR